MLSMYLYVLNDLWVKFSVELIVFWHIARFWSE